MKLLQIISFCCRCDRAILGLVIHLDCTVPTFPGSLFAPGVFVVTTVIDTTRIQYAFHTCVLLLLLLLLRHRCS